MSETLTRTTKLTGGGLLPLTAETILSFGMFLNDKLKDVSVVKAETLLETWLEKQDLEDRIVVGLDYKHVRSLVHVLEQNERNKAEIFGKKKSIKEVLENWLEKNKNTFTSVQKVAVGLTDEQVKSFSNRLATMFDIPHTQFIRQYNDWKLSQEFELQKEVETDKKRIELNIDWDNAPENCDVYEVRGQFTNSNYAGVNLPPLLYREKRPSIEVSIGQTWRNKETYDDFKVTNLISLDGMTRLDCGWIENAVLVEYNPLKRDKGQLLSRILLKDFLENFEFLE